MANAPLTTINPSPEPDDPRYPRPTWLRTIRWLFLHWLLISVICAITLILIYLLDMPLINQLLPFLTQYWWILTLSVIAIILLLLGAYAWANSDDTHESNVLRQLRQRQLEQRPPPPGFNLHHTLRGHTQPITQIAWSPDGRLLASCSADRTIRLWDTQTALLLHTLSGHSDEVNSVAWSADGRLLASASNDQTIRLWDAQSTHLLHTLSGHSDEVNSVAWSPGGRLLASASNDQTIRLWDTQSTHLLHILSGNSPSVYSVTWSPDGHLLASASIDNTIRLWDAATGRQIRTLEGHTAPIVSISFSAENRLLASKSVDATVRLWNLGSSQHLGNSACLIGTRAIKPTHRSRAKLSSDGKRGCASPSCSSSKNEIR
jgi:WD40 repeat protein